MEVLLGGLSSIFYGVADFLGGRGARKAPAASIVIWASVVGLPLLTIAAVAVGGAASVSDYALGGLAGGCGAFGLVALFAGLSRGRAAVVAPLSAALSAVLPVAVAIAGGESQSVAASVGLFLAVPAIFLCAWTVDTDGVRAQGLMFGAAAGLGFGGFTVIIRLTDPASNLLPLISARSATLVVVSSLGLMGLWRVGAPAQVPKTIVIGNGIFDVSANVTLLLALRAGSLALAAVAASFYPAVTVVLARVVDDERLRRRQVAGLALTIVSVGLIAV